MRSTARRVEAPVLVREATPDDAQGIGECHATAWAAAYRDLFEHEWLVRFTDRRRTMWPRVMSAPGFASSTVLVAERGAEIAAFACFGPARDRHREAELYALYAHPLHWGSGAAGAVMDSVVDALPARRWTRVRLWALAGGDRARAFYEKAGFAATGRSRERDYGDGRPVLEVELARSV